MFVYDGDPASLLFEFKVGGEFVSPSSASYTLRDHAGAAVGAQTAVVISVSGAPTQAVVTIDAGYNALDAESRVENRVVEVSFVYASKTYRLRQAYLITEYLNYTATPAQVRALLGVMDHELADEDIDLTSAYYGVETAVTTEDMDAAIAATDVVNLNVNRMIAIRAALNVIPSLRLRVMQKQSDENIEHQRLAKIDFAALNKDLVNEFANLYATVASLAADEQNLIILAGPDTDTITGE